MTFVILIALAAFIYYVLKNGQHAKNNEKTSRKINYLKDEHLLPKNEKFNLSGMEWWPKKVVAKENWYLEKVDFKALDDSTNPMEVGDEVWLDFWQGQVFPTRVSYGYAFDGRNRDGSYVNSKYVNKMWSKAGAEKRVGAVVRDIDRQEKEIALVLFATDIPLPWHQPANAGFHIRPKSFDKLVAESSSVEELDSKIRDWWKKRDERAAKKAAKKASE